MIITLILLAIAFGALFLHNWKLYELSLQPKPSKGNIGGSDDEEDDLFEDFDPKLRKRLLQTRRKSVAFSVCTVDNENMTFDLDRKKVFLGAGTTLANLPSDRIPLSSACALPTLLETCETEKIGSLQGIPLGLGDTVQNFGKLPGNRGRRMSVPAVPFISEEVMRVGSMLGHSTETII